MKITDAFRGEHGVFYAQFDHLENALQLPGGVDCLRAVAAMLAAALETHAHLEDELLFDRLLADAAPGPAAVMEQEHREIEDTLRACLVATDATEAATLLRDAISMAREHFLKEETVAFPLAEERLDDVTLHALGHDWAMRRAVLLV
jgi:hemerythrin-like domain-containing protein